MSNFENKLLIKIGDFIVNFRYLILGVFIALTTIGLINLNNVKINNSIVSYLPDKTETKYGLNLMEEEFGQLNNIKVMVSDIKEEDALKIKDELAKIDLVKAVLYDEDMYYKDSKALYNLTLIDASIKDLRNTKNEIDKVLKDYKVDTYYSEADDATEGTTLVLILSIMVITIVILLTSKSYFDPIIAFIIFGISIVLNMGSNFLLGEISYITKSIAVILQLALSIDYVIIFMNHFTKEISELKDNKILAIKKSTSKAMKEIFASSLTTIAGLIALVFMQLKIGEDIGIVLAKGIVCSFLTVILLMPCLLSIFAKPILKLQHKSRMFKTTKLTDFIVKYKKILLPTFILLIIFSIYMVPKYNYVYNPTSANSIFYSDNTISLNKMEKTFGKDNNLVILFKNKDKDYNKELEFANKLLALDKVNSVNAASNISISDNLYLGTKIDNETFSEIVSIDYNLSSNLFKFYQLKNNTLDDSICLIDLINFIYENKEELNLSKELEMKINLVYNKLKKSITMLETEEYSRFILNISMPLEDKKTYEFIEQIRNIGNSYYDDIKLVGNSINAEDLKKTFTSDNIIISLVTILFIAIILLATFKSLGMTLLLILTIESSIFINFAFITLINKEIFFMGYVVISAIQMGATIDYAIIIANRYQQLRNKKDKLESMKLSLDDSLPAIITSGLIMVIAGLLIGFISTSAVISSIGLFLGVGTSISLIGTIFILPSILYSCDKIILATTFKSKKVEYLDLYDEFRNKTGKKIKRGKGKPNFPDNNYIIITVIYIENSNGEFLIQKTSKEKGSIFATTGGLVSSGNDSINTIIIEAKEELGLDIQKSELTLVKTYKHEKCFVDSYYINKDIDINSLTLQKEEVEYVKWLNIDKVNELIFNNEFRASNIEQFKDILEYKKKQPQKRLKK